MIAKIERAPRTTYYKIIKDPAQNFHAQAFIYFHTFYNVYVSSESSDETAQLCIYLLAPRLLNFFSCSTQLSTKFILLINLKMPTIVGILTLISMINTTKIDLNQELHYLSVF